MEDMEGLLLLEPNDPMMIRYQYIREITNYFSDKRKLGSGIFGEAYKGLIGDDEKQAIVVVTVKMLRQDIIEGLEDKEFGNRSQEFLNLKHMNIVQLIGYCTKSEEVKELYEGRTIPLVHTHRSLCFDYVPNRSLAEFLSKQYLIGLHWKVRFKIIKEICNGLCYLHDHNVLHLDLKPENILLDRNMVAKIADFGLSSFLSQQRTKTIIASEGTRGYLPPEFLTTQVITAMHDIFSLGAIIKRIVIAPMDHLMISNMDERECIEHVHNYWTKRIHEARWYTSPEVDCKQVRGCIELAFDCMQNDPRKRPPIRRIMDKMVLLESLDYMMLVTKDIRVVKVRRMSFKELEDITNKFADQIGQDGRDVVYKGRLVNGEVIAVRRLHKDSRTSEQQCERMINLMSVQHKNVLQLKGYCFEARRVPVPHGEEPFVIYKWQEVIETSLCHELLQNGSLELILNDRNRILDWQTRHSIIRGICEGLHYLLLECQDAPIVHEDVKPANILLDDGMVPKLGDFCTSMSDPSRGYAAPEFMDTGKVTAKSNIYSLGIIIIELATGEKCPNHESSSQSYIKDVLKTWTQDSYVSWKYPSLEVGFVQQVESWISIGLQCVEIQPERRPTIGQIMNFLETESANPEYYDHGEFSLTSGNNVTSWLSSELVDHENELAVLENMLSDDSMEPANLAYALLKSITRNFSQVIGRAGFGVVYQDFCTTVMEEPSNPITELGRISIRTLRAITNDFSEDLRLDSGLFGDTYMGVLEDRKVIAVKVLRSMPWDDELQFDNISEKLMEIKHENLVKIVGFCNAEEHGLEPHDGKIVRTSKIYMALCSELVPNGNLAKFLSEQYLGVNWQVCFKIIQGICKGLQHLHEASIVHSHLRPENVFLDEKMIPKIVDFGLETLVGQENTKAIVAPGASQGYVPPEFITGRRGTSKAHDIYSLGAIIKKIVAGIMDYMNMSNMNDEESIELVHNIWRKRLQEIRGYPSLEADCKQVRTCITIAVRCTRMDINERPSMKDIVSELSEVEYKENGPGSSEEQGIRSARVRKMSFKELEDITNKFSEKLGRGAVYKGNLADGEEVAVKRLDENSRKSEERFEKIVNLMRQEHKNILRLKGYCYETRRVLVPSDKNPEIYTRKDVTENLLCYEFLPNGSMERIISDKSSELDWTSRHTIIRGICEGLYYLHEGCQDAPIVHKGLKPSNILLDDDMVPKLGDFGVSRVFAKEHIDIATNIAIISRGYIAPDFMDTGKVTVQSNIYSLGVLIIEIATGVKCPSDESSGRSYIENVLKTRMQRSNVASKYPSLEAGFLQQVECWINIGLKCVEMQPERRPTIGQIIHFLETESANSEYYHYGEFNLSFGSGITSWSSSEIGDHANELEALESMLSDTSQEPTKLSYTLLKSVTRNFSRMIGRGGFGAVYLGVLRQEKVAVKKLSILQDLSNNAFVYEIKCFKKAKHNNVVRLLGYCAVSHGELVEFKGTHVIAEETQRLLCFEYVPNGDLHDYIREKCRGDEWQTRYNIIKGVCNGLHYLHKQRISHLDLKSENVLLDANMDPKITDFGLSRFLPEGQSIMMTKQIFGTLGSIAPELINSGEISFKTDIYGLGIIITKLLIKDNNYDFENWHKSLEVSCSQEKRCVEMAKRCVEYSQDKRPTTDEIIHELNDIDNMIQEVPPVIQ